MDNTAPPPLNPDPAPAAPDAAAPDYSAGFWLRAGAYMIDGLLFATAIVGLDLILGPAGTFIALILWVGYTTIMPVRAQGQTLGKMAAGVAIVRDDGSPLTYGRTFARSLGYMASGFTFYLGFLCAVFTNRKRALHDYIAGTRVLRVEEIGLGRKAAVILVGLLIPMFVVLGIGAMLADPNFSNLIKASADEGTPQNRLAVLRSAAAIYYGDSSNSYPADLNALAPKYVPVISPAGISSHPGAAGVEVYGAEVCSGSSAPGATLVAAKLRDTGKWGYVVAPKAPCDGQIFIDCTHQDAKGSAWYTY